MNRNWNSRDFQGLPNWKQKYIGFDALMGGMGIGIESRGFGPESESNWNRNAVIASDWC